MSLILNATYTPSEYAIGRAFQAMEHGLEQAGSLVLTAVEASAGALKTSAQESAKAVGSIVDSWV